MPRDLYRTEIEFRFAPPLLVWCSGCWAAHEPNPHLDRPADDGERDYVRSRNLNNFMRQNREVDVIGDIVTGANKAVRLANSYRRRG